MGDERITPTVPRGLNTYDIEEVLDEFDFADGCINAGDEDAWRMATEILRLRTLLYEFDLYASTDPDYPGSPFHAEVRAALKEDDRG